MNRSISSALIAAGTTALVSRIGRGATFGSSPRWTRTNYNGDPVSLWEGPALVAGQITGALALAGAEGGAGALTAAGAGVFGALDDHAGDASSKGLKGHLGALRRGQLTTGAIKIVGLAVTGLAATAIADRGRSDRAWYATLVGGAVVAGSANVINLLDLRPGRALKAGLIIAAPLRGGIAAAAAGACVAALPGDLAGRSMLGDTGSNALGAQLGVALVARTGLPGRLLALTAVTALTLASERWSFTRVIETTPGLRQLDALGRPAPPAR